MAKGYSRRDVLRLGAGTLAAGLLGRALPAEAKSTAPVTLTLWTFVDTHARWFKQMAQLYRQHKNPNFQLNVVQYPYATMFQKLLLAFESGVNVPDLADVEQGAFGEFLFGKKVPFVDLTSRLRPWFNDVVISREKLYAWGGKFYGVEHALCPVVLYYRWDIFREAGIKTPIATWDEFIAAGKKLRAKGHYALPLDPFYFEILLRQRGFDVFDAQGHFQGDSPEAVTTLEWFWNLGAKEDIAAVPHGIQNPAGYWSEFESGRFVGAIGADWYGGFFKDNAATMAGKWRAQPLPVFTSGVSEPRPTSCVGGTGITISNPRYEDVAWDFIAYCFLTVNGMVLEFLDTTLWPPFKPAWKDPRLHRPDPYFDHQDLGALFSEVGPHVPVEYQSPFRPYYESTYGKNAPLWYTGKLSSAAFLRQVGQAVRQQMKKEASAVVPA